MTETASINGKSVDIRQGESILEAAQRAGHQVPTLCFDPRLKALGSCRLCLVKVKGANGLVASCAHSLRPGMEVVTEDEELSRIRTGILELVLSENPEAECVKCRQEGQCQLHRMAVQMQARRWSGSAATSGSPARDGNPFILRNYDQCIYCYRCTRVCAEVEQAHAIAPAGRGFQTRIAAAFDGSLLDETCTFCGQCVQTCPTGALTNRKMSIPEEAGETKRVKTICPFCGTGCGIELHVANNQLLGASPDWQAPANRGSLCVKGQFGLDFVHSPDRLTKPLIRQNGGFREVSWDEAYALVAGEFSRIKAESGPDAFALWSSSRSTTESNYLMQKLARAVLGTNNIDNCART